jgi:RNA polymerase sigma-70 factor (ECF subfamily)
MSLAWHEIHDHLMTVFATFSFHRQFELVRGTSPALADFADPAALLDHLHQVQGDPEGKNRLLRALILVAQSNGALADCALTLLLLALWPGLDAVRQRSIRRRLDAPDEIASDVLARATEAFRSLDLARVTRIAATILRNIERDMIRARQRRQADPIEGGVEGLAELSELDGGAAADLLWRRDLSRLLGDDALLVRAVAIHGFTQAEVAAVLGLSADATRKRYQRAVRRLRKAFQEKF